MAAAGAAGRTFAKMIAATTAEAMTVAAATTAVTVGGSVVRNQYAPLSYYAPRYYRYTPPRAWSWYQQWPAY